MRIAGVVLTLTATPNSREDLRYSQVVVVFWSNMSKHPKRRGIYRPFVHVSGVSPVQPQTSLANAFSWESVLERECFPDSPQLNSTKAGTIVPVTAFNNPPLANFLKVLAPGVKVANSVILGLTYRSITKSQVEIRVHDYDETFSDKSREVYWIATVIKVLCISGSSSLNPTFIQICGYRLLVRYEGRDKEGDEQADFWVNLASDELKHVGYRYIRLSHTRITDRVSCTL